MTQKFTTPLAINKCKLGDRLVFSVAESTPSDFWMTIYDMAGSVVYTPGAYDLARDGELYWFVTFSAANGFDELAYYECVVADQITNGVVDSTFVVYVGNQTNFDSYITRALGLAGHNLRKYDYTWENGQLTAYKMKIYATAAALTTAENGGADAYLAAYQVSITYDNNYNRTLITSTKI